MRPVTIHVPATTANLGPGFDCLGLALDLWNHTTFSLSGERIRIKVHGRGSRTLPKDGRNLIARSALKLYAALGAAAPEGLLIECENHIPLDSGLGSSAAACLTGLLGANILLGSPCSSEEILRIATEMEGHPDNVAASLSGGLALVSMFDGKPVFRCLDLAPIEVVVTIPQVNLSTHAARAALPREVPLRDAVFNIARTAFVIESFRTGDFGLLGQAMDDRLHQPYRLKLIPGAQHAIEAARQAGAVSAVLSGAGPSIIAFCQPDPGDRPACIAKAMIESFSAANVQAESLLLQVSLNGAWSEQTA